MVKRKCVLFVFLLLLISCNNAKKAEYYENLVAEKMEAFSYQGIIPQEADCRQMLLLYDTLFQYKETAEYCNSAALFSLILNEPEKALPYLDKSLELDKENVEANYFKGLIYSSQGDQENAESCLRQSVNSLRKQHTGDYVADMVYILAEIRALSVISKEEAGRYIDSLIPLVEEKESVFILENEKLAIDSYSKLETTLPHVR